MKIKNKKIKFNIPNQWNSLTDRQLKKIAILLFSVQNTKLIDFKVFKVFANSKWYKLLLNNRIRLLFKYRQVSEIKKSFTFIYTQQNLTRFIPIVKVGRKKYYAPTDRLTNLTIGEFSLCEDLYLGYLRNVNNNEANNGESYLRYLFAVLYITQKNKIRPNFNKNLLEEMVNQSNKVTRSTLFTTLLSYKGCRDAISNNKKYIHIFPKSKKTESKSKKEIPQSAGFSDVILSFSNKTFGDYHKTFATNLYTFLDGYEMTLANQPKEQ